MIRQLLSAGMLLFSVSFARAQENNLLWAQSFGSAEFDMVRDIATDSDGNVISVGQFTNTIDFDPGAGVMNLTSAGASDIFIKKQNADGDLIWAKRIGDYDGDAAYGVDVDAANNVYITGVFRQEVDFDPGAGSYVLGYGGTNLGQIFLLKLDMDGDLVWVNHMGVASGTSQGLVIAVEPSGAAVISGTFYTTVDFDPSAGTANLTANTTTNYDIFVARYSVDGDYVWARSFGGDSGNNFPEDIVINFNNSIILTGSFGGTADLDPTAGTQMATSNGFDDAFILKLSSSGAFEWAHSFGGAWGDVAYTVTVDTNDDIYVAGSFRQDVDLNPGPGTEMYSIGSNENTFIMKLNWAGPFQWVKVLSGGYNAPRSIDTDASNNIYVSGGFSQTTDLDPGAGVVNHTSADNFDDMYLLQLDYLGNYAWSKTIGTTSDDRAEAIEVIGVNELYMAGFHTNSVDFNPSGDPYFLNAIGGTDAFVSYFGACNVDVSVSTSGVTLTAGQSNATYQWMDCSIFSNVPGATSQSFTPTADGGYAVVITQGACKDTSTCYTVQGVGLNENTLTDIQVYPNPATSTITVQAANPVELVEIYSLQGTLVLTEQRNIVSIENLPAGVYMIRVKTAAGISHARFVKE